jgi:Family of unknown function (DUF6275)
MADNLKGIPFSSDDEGQTFPEMAKDLVFDQMGKAGILDAHPTFSLDGVYVVWFTYILGNWKALCSTSLPDGKYYEVTYDGQRKVAFVDTYVKVENQVIEVP